MRRVLCIAMKKPFSFCLLLLVSTALPLSAADYSVGVSGEKTKNGCKTSIQHQPAADVAFQPGVDAQGYAVAPAEETPPTLPTDSFTDVQLPLEAPLSGYYQPSGQGAKLSDSPLTVGQVKVNAQTGEVLMNGASLNPKDDCQ